MSYRAAIVGVSGYSGVELVRLFAHQNTFVLSGVVSDRWAGRSLGAWVSDVGDACRLEVASMSHMLDVAQASDLIFLATPADASMEMVPRLLEMGKRVVDLSGAYRLSDRDLYPRWYGFDHTSPELLAQAHFGIPELPEVAGGGPSIREASLVANPGCYATAAILSLAPLCSAGVVSDVPIASAGMSGVSGAGRKLEERYLFMELAENVSAYRVGNHQHTPEIVQALVRAGRGKVDLHLVPHLLPIKRGLMVSSQLQLRIDADVQNLLRDRYRDCEGIEVSNPEEVSLTRVVHRNGAQLGGTSIGYTGFVTCALDNLRKGAASQAMTNALRMFGADEFLVQKQCADGAHV